MRPKLEFDLLKLPDLSEKRTDAVVTETRTYKLITPLFGGGVTPGECDPVTVVSGKNVRGQLRFWWRATRGGAFDGDRDEDTPFILQNGKSKPNTDSQTPAYAAFPLQLTDEEIKNNAPIKSVWWDVKFNLKISFPKQFQEDVHAALWAWETFGGVGARTRRGFGALARTNGQLPKSSDVKKYLSDSLKKHVADGVFPNDVPHLKRTFELNEKTFLKIIKNDKHVLKVWENLIKKYQKFRQFRCDKKTSKESDYGKSQWPEADVVRKKIKPPKGLKYKNLSVALEKFPRASFGLPIVFHFPKETEKIELNDIILSGQREDKKIRQEKIDRLASPLILRPVACMDGQFVGVAVVLDAPRTPPGGLFLEGKDLSETLSVSSELTQQEARNITHGLPPLKNKTDVIQAFLDFLS